MPSSTNLLPRLVLLLGRPGPATPKLLRVSEPAPPLSVLLLTYGDGMPLLYAGMARDGVGGVRGLNVGDVNCDEERETLSPALSRGGWPVGLMVLTPGLGPGETLWEL
jgi:hypothetical protein